MMRSKLLAIAVPLIIVLGGINFSFYSLGFKVIDISCWGSEGAILFYSSGHYFVTKINLTKFGIRPIEVNLSATSIAIYNGKIYFSSGSSVYSLNGSKWSFPSKVISIRPSKFGVLVLTSEGLYSLNGKILAEFKGAISFFPIGWKVYVVFPDKVMEWQNLSSEIYHVKGVRCVFQYKGGVAFLLPHEEIDSSGKQIAKSSFELYSAYGSIVGGRGFVGYVSKGEVIKGEGCSAPGVVKWILPLGKYYLIGSTLGYLSVYNPKIGLSFQISLGLLSGNGFSGEYYGIAFYRGVAVLTGNLYYEGHVAIVKYDGCFLGASPIYSASSQIYSPAVYNNSLFLLTAKGKVIEYNGYSEKIVFQDKYGRALYSWAVYKGVLYLSGIGGAFIEYNGKEWKELSYFNQSRPNLWGMAPSREGLWIVGSGGTICLLNGSSLKRFSVSPATVLTSVSVSNLGLVAIGGQHGILYIFNGSKLRLIPLPTIKNVLSLDWINDSLYIFGEGFIALLKFNGSKYSLQFYDLPFSIEITRTSVYRGTIYGVGSNGTFFAINREPVNIQETIEKISNVPMSPYRTLTILFLVILGISAVAVYFLTKKWASRMRR